MDFIRVTNENLEKEHICCAISGAEAQCKKEWLRNRFEEGLVFLKGDVRGKCFKACDTAAPYFKLMAMPFEKSGDKPVFREQAQNFYSPFSTFSLYYDGVFLTHEILSEKKFEKILAEKNH